MAVAAALARQDRALYVLERNASFGQETSGRNSEVIHSGIYYPQNSLKARTCVRGNRLIYELCAKNNIPCEKRGKLIIASEEKELAKLNELLRNGQNNDVQGLKIISEKEIKDIEPNIRALAALYSPDTGIVDSHNLMHYFFQRARAEGGEFVFEAEVRKIKKQGEGFEVTVCDADGSDFLFFSRILINCAGLSSDIVAGLAGIDTGKENYTLKFCKGQYFRVGAAKSRMITHLVYPVPDEKHGSLGIHATPDLGKGLRLGPDAEYIERDKADYSVDDSRKEHFWRAANRFLPFIEADDLTADTSGIRPKLQGENEPFRDFVISHEEEKGLAGLINLIGIDSPGLTAAAAIAKYVEDMVEKIL